MQRGILVAMIVGLTLGSLSETALQGAPLNGGFEAARTVGWSQEISRGFSAGEFRSKPAGSIAVTSEWQAPGIPSLLQRPESGKNFVAISTLADGNFIGDRTYQIFLSQTISLQPREIISGWASFFNGDYENQDQAWVRIWDSRGQLVAMPWQAHSGYNPDQDQYSSALHSLSPWTQWSWQSESGGKYTLGLGMTTADDNNQASYSFFDGILKSPGGLPVPEPTTLGLVLTAASALGLGRRRATHVKPKSQE